MQNIIFMISLTDFCYPQVVTDLDCVINIRNVQPRKQAILAGYIAWKSFRTTSDTEDNLFNDDSSVTKRQTNFIKMGQNGFWAFVDMASGKYLWRNLNQIKQVGKVKTNS
ncbi:uncharacterized protein [Rutidosis leptorrhynchoides]|uniref:uncharacterized protein n=1 Tax=Rutidosis leptorrhynchoides TaxID=125765 RepID=UPI003A98CF3D